MIVTTKTTVIYKIPEENDKLQKFLKANDMEKWEESLGDKYVSYTYTESTFNDNEKDTE